MFKFPVLGRGIEEKYFKKLSKNYLNEYKKLLKTERNMQTVIKNHLAKLKSISTITFQILYISNGHFNKPSIDKLLYSLMFNCKYLIRYYRNQIF